MKYEILVLATKYTDPYSKLVCFLTGRKFSHISIGIKDDIFYSFTKKGFTIEKPKKYAPKTRCKDHCLMTFNVSKNQYEEIEKTLEYMKEHKEDFKYSKLALILSLIGIHIRRKNKFFCSQFVAKLLKDNNVCILEKKETSYYPTKLYEKLKHQSEKNNTNYI